jgi:hypothetical protein
MGDPVTMAVVGASVGAMMNKKDPLKGAMLGAVGGYGGAALMPAGAAGTYTGLGMAGTSAGTAAGTTSALTGTGASTAAFINPTGVNAGANALMGASQAVPTGATATPGIFSNVTAPISISQPLTYEQATATGLQRSYGLESLLNPNIESSSMAPSFMEQVGSGAGQVGQFAQQNPVLTQMAMQSAQQMMQQPQRRSQPPGLLRGNQMQASAPQYQVGVPQVSLI